MKQEVVASGWYDNSLYTVTVIDSVEFVDFVDLIFSSLVLRLIMV